jgi:predicted metal-dependent peptidase
MDVLVQRAKVQLMLDKPFWGSLAARLELKEWDRDTFATDGKYILIPAKKYYDGSMPKYPLYDRDQLRSVIAHEVGHCALLHLFRMGKRNPFGWNIAGDFVINQILEADGFAISPGWLLDKRFEGMTTEKVYDLLKKESDASSKKCSCKDGDNCPHTLDPFGNWHLPENMKDVKPSPKNGKGENPDEVDWKEAISNAYQIAKQQGKVPNGMDEYIQEFLDPKIPWQQVLMRYLQASNGSSDYQAYPFRRAHLHRNFFMSSLAGESIEVACAIDTSGSIGQDEFKSFLGEICGICSAFGEYKIHLFQCDAKVQDYTEIESEADIPHHMKGRGGTSFIPVFEKIQELELDDLPLVYFTDLCGSFPSEERSGVYWVVKEEWTKQFKAPFGEVIELN